MEHENKSNESDGSEWWSGIWKSVTSDFLANVMWWLFLLILTVVWGVLSLPSDNNKNQSTQNHNENNKTSLRTYSIQEKVQVGSSEINLYDMRCGFKEYQEYYEAKGEFCVVDTLVVNRSNSTESLIPHNWKLYVGDREFKVTSYEGEAFDDILPGSSGSGTVAFDIAINSVPNSILVDGVGSFTKEHKINF